jgi:hypothetical protein
MESVRVQLSGKRIKANGRIVAAEADTNPAFAAYYDLLTDETGATKRLGMTVTLAERVFSPFFNALPIRRVGLHERADSITVSTIYVSLPDMTVASAAVSYSSSAVDSGEGIKVHSPVSDTTLTVDADGFIVDYPGLAERI